MPTVLELDVSAPLWIPKPLVSCSAAAADIAVISPLFYFLLSLCSPALIALISAVEWCSSARIETFREWLQPPLSPSLHPLHSSLIRRLAAVQTRLKASLPSSIKTPRVVTPLSGTRRVSLSCRLKTSQPFVETAENSHVARASCFLKLCIGDIIYFVIRPWLWLNILSFFVNWTQSCGLFTQLLRKSVLWWHLN